MLINVSRMLPLVSKSSPSQRQSEAGLDSVCVISCNLAMNRAASPEWWEGINNSADRIRLHLACTLLLAGTFSNAISPDPAPKRLCGSHNTSGATF